MADGDQNTKLFFKSSKAMSAAKQIHKLVDEDGQEANTWEEMVALMEAFFGKMLGSRMDGPSTGEQPEFQNQVLEVILDRLTIEEKDLMNALLTLEELEAAVSSMKKLKCPGLDGAQVEFFLAMWPTAGPIILQVLNRGILREDPGRDYTRIDCSAPQEEGSEISH